MSLENVRLQLADAEVAGVAEVSGGSAADVRGGRVHRLQRSCRGRGQTYASATASESSTSGTRAEVAEVFHSFTRAQARARTRAREEERGKDPLQPVQPLHVPGLGIILRHCRCIDCRNFPRASGEYFCSEYIGGTKVSWATGKRQCDPPPEAWHYCACYHGPQISKDVWLWPRRSHHVPPGSTIAPKAEQPDEDEELI